MKSDDISIAHNSWEMSELGGKEKEAKISFAHSIYKTFPSLAPQNSSLRKN